MDSFKTLQDSISGALVSTTRAATRLSNTDIPFQRSLDPSVGTALDQQNARLLHLAERLLQTAAASSDGVGPKLPDVDAIDGNWRGIVDVVDSLLEKADTSLDEYTGVVKRLAQTSEQVGYSMRFECLVLINSRLLHLQKVVLPRSLSRIRSLNCLSNTYLRMMRPAGFDLCYGPSRTQRFLLKKA